ncbi:hypothetical protein ENUP19_0378G0045 [Entamoeba nuttalli]|uniref:Uncharacterized protein n=2 Tax=Entamoeba nuttalli TaxID=412467 RepID=K2GWP1_ENTNP|nr:hypothetical protein ENU1_173870 [Entamoeba nuttalli P19]EKE38177.1 hypothetical protein ENU1_173870 [Entamoeba nuttalli P19]|eukprot:XP_008859487.1 hypothetical protein ENU1_173870 [Entamoeba nuttalli P19]
MNSTEYIVDSPKASYGDIKKQYFDKINISLKDSQIEDEEFLCPAPTIEKPRTISKPMRIPKDKNSLGDDVLKYMLKGSDDEVSCSPPSNFKF